MRWRLFATALTAVSFVADAAHGAGNDDDLFASFRLEENEARLDGHRGYAWGARGWIGTDYDKVFLKTEGETESGKGIERAETQLLYSRLISDFFDLQAGVRHDVEPEPSRTYAVIGLQGLAPYFFEIDAALFLGEEGLSARLEAEYELPITQRLWLQPKVEVGFSARDDTVVDVAAGPTGVEAGLRLRYEFRREFAPYVGVVYDRALSGTADLARARGRRVGSAAFVAGIRLLF